MTKRLFTQYIGIDYSGARTPEQSLKGIRVYQGTPDITPEEVDRPQPSPKKYWTRKEIAFWIVETLKDSDPTIIGIDHGFSFPIQYFEKYGISHDWDVFLNDFCKHWPTHEDNMYVDFVRDGLHGNGAARTGDKRWRRLSEVRAKSAKSVFFFDVQGSVAKSTHSGIPWLKYIRDELGDKVHFWPFDGWIPKKEKHVIVEVYPSLWKNSYLTGNMTPDQRDAYVVAAWLRDQDAFGRLRDFYMPSFESAKEQEIAEIEGWILGVG